MEKKNRKSNAKDDGKKCPRVTTRTETVNIRKANLGKGTDEAELI